jgi:hypothetical protein
MNNYFWFIIFWMLVLIATSGCQFSPTGLASVPVKRGDPTQLLFPIWDLSDFSVDKSQPDK